LADGVDTAHLTWVIDQRAKIQHTLLALYTYLNETGAQDSHAPEAVALNDLIAAAFSLWRAIFLTELERTDKNHHQAQVRFLKKVITTNAIAFQDDLNSSTWSLGFYMENAMHRVLAAHVNVQQVRKDAFFDKAIQNMVAYGDNTVKRTRHEWTGIHKALRETFRLLNPASTLTIDPVTDDDDPIWDSWRANPP
jgi:hypothetical protein